MIKDCAWVPQHRRTRLLLANTSKPIARFSVSAFASYPLSILIGVHHDAGLAPQPRGRPHHAIAAARVNEFDLGGVFQPMVGQHSSSANGLGI
jgi:hypothetical protein